MPATTTGDSDQRTRHGLEDSARRPGVPIECEVELVGEAAVEADEDECEDGERARDQSRHEPESIQHRSRTRGKPSQHGASLPARRI